MTTKRTPQDAAMAVVQNPTLPTGDDERFIGFGVMGLPFGSGHYLASRHFPATSFSPAYHSVWHRDPAGTWTFYATTPGQQSCSRYFSSATPNYPPVCDIDVAWTTPWSLAVSIPGLLEWDVDISTTLRTRLMSKMGESLPAGAWTNRPMLGVIGRMAGPMLGAGELRLAGTAPNGQWFMIAPKRVWAVTASRAVLRGKDLGPVGPLKQQARLADFRCPQRGVFVVGSGHFEPFSAGRHRSAGVELSPWTFE